MRGTDKASGSLFSYVDLEERVPAGHPLRKIRQIVNDALASLDALYTDFGRPSIAPERLIRARADCSRSRMMALKWTANSIYERPWKKGQITAAARCHGA